MQDELEDGEFLVHGWFGCVVKTEPSAAQALKQKGRNAFGPHAFGADPGQAELAGDEQAARAGRFGRIRRIRRIGLPALQPDLLADEQRGRARLLQRGGDGDAVIQPRRMQVVHAGAADDEHAALPLAQTALAQAACAQLFGAGALEKAQVVGVIDDTARGSCNSDS